MAADKYPLGIQTFSKLIEEGYTYIDKTAFLIPLIKKGGFFFLSRPRRFGKSLLLSTLHAYFDGCRQLFRGLALDRADVDWTPTPVLHFDFNAENYMDPEGLYYILHRHLKDFEKQYGILPDEATTSIPGRFATLLKTIYEKTGRKVAILVDEYDKPLLGLEENKGLFEKNQALLKGFFGNLKTMDPYIRFALLTGVARFHKVSIFSDLNNLWDISMTNEFADICGWTEQELTGNFRTGIEALSAKLGETYEGTVGKLRHFYDGYLFSEEGSRLYNPYSVLMALRSQQIEPYWYETGTPTFLAKRVKASGLTLPDLDRYMRSRSELLEVGVGTENPLPLMFQTGYLTIDYYDRSRGRYKLRFPNREVEMGFAQNLYPLYIPGDNRLNSPFGIYYFQDDLFEGKPEDFMKRLETLLKDLPYEMHNEGNYQNIVWLICTLCGTDSLPERHSHQGRADLEVKTPDYIYIFEFKYNQSADAAMAQLRDRDYAGHHALDGRQVYLIAANLSTERPDRGLTAWQIEKL